MSRTPLIAGNWKMNKTGVQAAEAAAALIILVKENKEVDVLIAPTYTALFQVYQILQNSSVALGAQDLFWENEGAFTGEISAEMLVDAGCSHVIIGHSERRQYFHETDETVNRKIKARSQSKTDTCFMHR
jgi:triosephosphate isomerase